MICVDVVKEDPTNNVPDSIFSKLGLQLHRRDNHPLGILKNGIYDYFDSNYPNQFEKFDDLCPIVSVKQVSYMNLRKHRMEHASLTYTPSSKNVSFVLQFNSI